MTNLELGKHRAADLGLKITNCVYWPARMNLNQAVYMADDIHKLMGAGVEVYGVDDPYVFTRLPPVNGDTTTGLVIGVRPLVKESREQKMEVLLSELVAAQQFANLNITYIPEDWAKRAKALLNGDK